MPSVLIALCVTTLVVVTYAEPPVNIGLGDLGIGDGGYSSGGSLSAAYGAPDAGASNGGYGGGNSLGGGYSDGSNGGEIIATPSIKGIRYAGPIVYTNEKPPVIHFPPPPKPKKGGGYGKGGKGGKGHSIKYVPLPHHDLPVLIYQSDINPPIHVVHPPNGAIQQEAQASYGPPPQAEYGAPLSSSSSSGGYASSSSPGGYSSSISSSQSLDGYKPGPPPSTAGFQPGPPPEYGVPKVINGGASSVNSQLNSQYGPPAQTQTTYVSQQSTIQYGPPQAQYGPPPKAQKAAPLPHIIYSGHPPIHIFQQPPIYMSAPKAASYGPPPTSLDGYKPGPPPKGGSYGPSQKSHGSKSSKSSFGSSKSHGSGSSHSISFSSGGKGWQQSKGEYGPPKGDHGQQKGEHGTSSKSAGSHLSHHLSHLSNLKSHFHQLYKSHFSKSLNSLHNIHNKYQQAHSSHASHSSHSGHSSHSSHSAPQKAHKAKSSYVVAPKAWNRPPIIIYQGVRPPVHVYEKPNGGGYADANVVQSSHVSIGSPAPVAITHAVSPIALEAPVAAPVLLDQGQGFSLEHAHVAGTNQAGNPAAQNVDLTYGIARISTEGGQFIDPRYKSQVAEARTIWVPNYGLPQASSYVTQPQPAVYVSDLTSAGQQFQLLRRNDVLDQNILSSISALRAEAEQTADPTQASADSTTSVQPSPEAQAQIQVLPTFLSSANEDTLSSIPVSYTSVLVPQASASNRSGEPAPDTESPPDPTVSSSTSSESTSASS